MHLRLALRNSRKDIPKAIGWPTKATRWVALRMYEGGLLVGSAWAWPDFRKPARHKCSLLAGLEANCTMRIWIRARGHLASCAGSLEPVYRRRPCWMPSSGCFSTSAAHDPPYLTAHTVQTCTCVVDAFRPGVCTTFSPTLEPFRLQGSISGGVPSHPGPAWHRPRAGASAGLTR